MLLCRRHHREVHEGEYSIRKGPDGVFRFFDKWDREVVASSPLGPATGEPPRVEPMQPYLTDRCDYSLAVEFLQASAHPPDAPDPPDAGAG
jgi:hypothetical protein